MNAHFESLRISRYPARSLMAEHVHDEPSLCILISGAYEENVRGRRDVYLAGNLSFCPAHEPHSQRIGRAGASKLLLNPTRSGLELLSAHVQLDDAPSIRAEAVATIGRRMRCPPPVAEKLAMVSRDIRHFRVRSADPLSASDDARTVDGHRP